MSGVKIARQLVMKNIKQNGMDNIFLVLIEAIDQARIITVIRDMAKITSIIIRLIAIIKVTVPDVELQMRSNIGEIPCEYKYCKELKGQVKESSTHLAYSF